MSASMRKLIGTIALLVMLTIYAFIAVTVAVVLEVNTSSKWIELVYYAGAGLLWVIPAAGIVQWMAKTTKTP